MSRSGYTDDCENLAMWRGAVNSSIRGKRGQAFLKEMLAALDAMPVKELVANDLERDGQVCALGCVGKARGLDHSAIDPEESEVVAEKFGVARALACEIMYENDEGYWNPSGWKATETPEGRWQRMRAWVAKHIRQEESDGTDR